MDIIFHLIIISTDCDENVEQAPMSQLLEDELGEGEETKERNHPTGCQYKTVFELQL